MNCSHKNSTYTTGITKNRANFCHQICSQIAILLLVFFLASTLVACSRQSIDAPPTNLYSFTDVQWGSLSNEGNIVLWDSGIIPLSRLSGGWVAYQERNSLHGGVVDPLGHRRELKGWVVSTNTQFVNGRAPARIFTGSAVSPQYFYIDPNGRKVIEQRFYGAMPFSEGLAAVMMAPTTAVGPKPVSPMWGYIDLNGRLVIPCSFSEASEFNAGRAVVKIGSTGDKAIIDSTGRVIFSTKEPVTVHRFSKDGLAVFDNQVPHRCPNASVLPACGLLDTEGHVHAAGVRFLNFSNGLGCLPLQQNRIQFADANGVVRLAWNRCLPNNHEREELPRNLIINAPNLETEPVLSDGMIAIPVDRYLTKGYLYRGFQTYGWKTAYGFIDASGNKIPIRLHPKRVITQAFPFSEGYAIVETAIPSLNK